MRAPLSWLRKYVQIGLSVEELASRLALTGTEVERVAEVGVPGGSENLGCFVVGKVLECERHPDADKLSVCRVEAGDGQPRTIVCGAPNVKAGQTVAVVLPGGTLPGGMVIKEAKLRGVASAGMLLSETELGLAAKSPGIMILPDEWEAGDLLSEHFAVSDMVLEVEVTPNRPDCLSIVGLAREIGAVTQQSLEEAGQVTYSCGDRRAEEDIEIEVMAPDLCPRYAGRIIRGVTIGESPLWMKALLAHAGMRPISNAVDVTNYVLWSLGQPLHAFDLGTVRGGKIVVRRATPAETITTLDGQVRELTTEMLVIADAEKALVVAGIMGGLESEITDSTTDILLEGANFTGPSIMRTSSALGLRSEASTRYEKGLDPEAIDAALDMACGLLVSLCGGTVSLGTVDVRTANQAKALLRLRDERIEQVLGVAVPPVETEGLLRRLGCEVTRVAQAFQVVVPSFRADLEREIDLIEEVARVYGLDRIPATLPARESGRGGLTRRQSQMRKIEDLLEGAGLVQVLNYSFTDQRWPEVLRLEADDARREAVVISNPLSAEQSVMRTMLLPGLLATAQRNVSVREEQVPIFEMGRVYLPGEGQLPEEPVRLGILVSGAWEPQSWLKGGPGNGYFLVKGLLERLSIGLHASLRFSRITEPFLHPGRSACVRDSAGRDLGWIGEVHPLVAQTYDLRGPVTVAELHVEGLLAAAPEVVTFTDLLAYPAVEQDVALVVDAALPAADLIESVRSACGKLLQDVAVFDLYEGAQVGEGKKSIALRLSFRSADRTLSEDEINQLRMEMLKRVSAETGADLRG
jgi:phenylalanyl-tRNA synthetase beta chain